MGQKVNPIGFRLGKVSNWSSVWYAKEDYVKFFQEDYLVRQKVMKMYRRSGVSDIVIERSPEVLRVIINTARPGAIIGKKGADIDKLKLDIKKISKSSKQVFIDIKEIAKAELCAKLVGESIAEQLEKRSSFRRVLKKAIQSSMRMGALGIKIACSGRLNGVEIARSEWYKEGRIPLHTLKADIDYALVEANTTYGILGVKVWIYRGAKLKR